MRAEALETPVVFLDVVLLRGVGVLWLKLTLRSRLRLWLRLYLCILRGIEGLRILRGIEGLRILRGIEGLCILRGIIDLLWVLAPLSITLVYVVLIHVILGISCIKVWLL